MFFSTQHEPSKLSTPYGYSLCSIDKEECAQILQLKRDFLNPRLFQYSSIILPYGKSRKYLAYTVRALKNYWNNLVIAKYAQISNE